MIFFYRRWLGCRGALAGFIIAAWLHLGFSAWAEVKVLEGHISANFNEMTLEEALGEIADATHIEVVTSQALEQKILVSYQEVAVEKLLKQLLHGYNAMYLHNPDTGQLETVRIFSSSQPISTLDRSQSKPQQKGEHLNESTPENGKYYMMVFLDGKPFKMLVDTGASKLSISSAVAARLALKLGTSTAVNTASGQSNAYQSVIQSVAMAGKELKNVQTLILPQLKESGLIGQNVLAHFRRVTEEGKMRFEPLGVSNKVNKANTEKAKAETKARARGDDTSVPKKTAAQ